MPIKLAGRIAKTAWSVISGVVGLGTVGTIGLGSSLTGELILDAVIILGALIIIAINGKDGIPEWLVRIIESKVNKEAKKKK